MSEIEFNPKRWCMKMSKYHVRREEYDIASTFRSVAETLDSLKDANAALLARHNALMEAVKSEIAARDHDHFWRCNDATSGEELNENYVALEAARAEVDRILEDSNLADHNTYLEACLEDRNAEMMKHVRMYEALEDAVSWLLDIDDAWRVSCTRETDDAWVESQTSFTIARAEIKKLLDPV